MALKVNVKNSTSTITSLTSVEESKILNTKDKIVSDYITIEVESNTEDATATAADILASKTAYIADGTKATGTIESKTDSGNVTLDTTTTSKSYASGYYANEHGALIQTQTKTATTNGTINPDTGYVLNQVVVSIPVYDYTYTIS